MNDNSQTPSQPENEGPGFDIDLTPLEIDLTPFEVDLTPFAIDLTPYDIDLDLMPFPDYKKRPTP